MLLYYADKKENKIVEIQNYLQNKPFINDVSHFSPKSVYEELKKDLPFGNLTEKEIETIFPYLIKIKLKPEKISLLKKELENLKVISSLNLEILVEPPTTLLSFFQWKYFNYLLLLLLLFWNVFYLLFFYFLIKTLSIHSKDPVEIFQLLGGPIVILRLIKIIILVLPLILLSLFSFGIYSIIINKIIYIFPLFTFFPTWKNFLELLVFLGISLFYSLLYPVILIVAFNKKI
ncbi:MAG: permease-like cell division protein FtsX [Caldimicrobium sp.]